MKTGLVRTALAALALAATSLPGIAQDYPTKSVRLVVPFSPGGSVDLGARNLAEGLSQLWGQTVVVENMPGAGSQIGTAEVSQAQPDGYTLLYVSTAFATLPALKPDLPYKPTDFIPITATGDGQFVIAAGPKVQAATFEEFVEEAKARQVFYATSGNGSSGHLISEALNLVAGLEMQPVHFKSGGESVVDVAGGRVDIYVGVLSALLPMLQEGKVRILATMGSERIDSLPDAPTLTELGYENAEFTVWWGVFAPGGTPEDIVTKINQDVSAVMTDPKYGEFMTKIGAEFIPRTPAEFSEYVLNETEFWKKVVAERGIVQN